MVPWVGAGPLGRHGAGITSVVQNRAGAQSYPGGVPPVWAKVLLVICQRPSMRATVK